MIRKKLTAEEILQMLKKHKDDLKKYKVKGIALFGSYVKREQKKDSDIDLIVEFDLNSFNKDFEGLFETFMGLSNYFETLFGKKVDILTPDSIKTIRIKEVAEGIKKSAIYV